MSTKQRHELVERSLAGADHSSSTCSESVPHRKEERRRHCKRSRRSVGNVFVSVAVSLLLVQVLLRQVPSAVASTEGETRSFDKSTSSVKSTASFPFESLSVNPTASESATSTSSESQTQTQSETENSHRRLFYLKEFKNLKQYQTVLQHSQSSSRRTRTYKNINRKNKNMSSSIVDYCKNGKGLDPTENATDFLLCVTEQTQYAIDGSYEFTQQLLLVFAAALVFFMQAGFAALCAGAVRQKNVQNTLLKNLLDACGAAVAWFMVGYAFAFGGSVRNSPEKTFIGNTNFFLIQVDNYSFWLFQYAFSAAAATIIAGTLAERCQMVAYLCYSVLLAGFVYPVIVHSVWSPQGFLSATSVDPLFGVGMVDFAGSGVVHMTGGVTALFATIILGPRRGRFHDETGRRLDKPREFPGHSISLQMLGTFILWFGWYGFNSGSALLGDYPGNAAQVAALAGVNTTLSGGTAGIVALFVNLWVLERYTGEPYFDLKYAMNGSLCGLVAITGGCGVVEPWAAVVIGFIAGILYIIGSRALIRLRLDDAVDAIPVHMVNGMWGLIAVGLFASPSRLQLVYNRSNHPGWFYGDGLLFGTQLLGILFIVGWVFAIMLPFFVWLDWKGWFRSDPLEEIVGLDTSYHGGLALLGGGNSDDGINPEYISAYKKKKEEESNMRRRKKGPVTSVTVNGEVSDGDGPVVEGSDDAGENGDEEPGSTDRFSAQA